MKPTFFNGTLALLFIAFVSFQSCSHDQDAKPTPVPPVTPPVVKLAQDPPTNDIQSIAVTTCDFELNDAHLTDLGWEKVFEDDFSGDLSKWDTWKGGAFNNELQFYQGNNIAIVDGKLVITAKKETVTGDTNPYDKTQKTFNYTSGRIESKTKFSSSSATPKVRMIARIKLSSGYGMWPAFWSYGNDWPTQGEIDIIESRGQEQTKYHTNYFYGSTAGNNQVTNASFAINADDDLTACYHVYELIWERDKLISVLDGAVVEVKTSGGYITSLYGTQQRITLNLAVGGLFFNDLDESKIEPSSMSVDWVKVFVGN